MKQLFLKRSNCLLLLIIFALKTKKLKMKKTLLLLATPALLFFSSCGGSKTEESTVIPGMMEVGLIINGNNLSIMVPDSTKGRLQMVEQSWGATEIKVGDDFQISIEEAEGDIALMKSDINGNEVFKLQRFLKDEPALLFWEEKNPDLPKARFHFYSIIKTGSTGYLIKDIESGEAYNETAVQTMIDAAKTLKAKETTKADA